MGKKGKGKKGKKKDKKEPPQRKAFNFAIPIFKS